jgi:hypothetical protein
MEVKCRGPYRAARRCRGLLGVEKGKHPSEPRRSFSFGILHDSYLYSVAMEYIG